MFARLVQIGLALMLALPAGAFAQAMHWCRTLGQAAPAECCCLQDDGPAHMSVEKPGCCETLRTPTAPLPVSTLPPIPLAALAATPTVALPPPVFVDATPPRPLALRPQGARAPPPLHGRGIYLEVCSFLI